MGVFASSRPSIAFETLDNVDVHVDIRGNHRMSMRRARLSGDNVEIIAVDLLMSMCMFLQRPNHSDIGSAWDYRGFRRVHLPEI
jgi:hypothetical protein